MCGKHTLLKYLNFVILLQMLLWNVEGRFTNNHTLIKMLNAMNLSWTAGVNRMTIPSRFSNKIRKKSAGQTLKEEPIETPETFDSREHWKQCRSVIGRIRSQGKCDNCWAVASASVVSDRNCIGTNGSSRVHLSSEDVTLCCVYCSNLMCGGGFTYDAISYWMNSGIVTGGEIKSEEGCKPYSANLHVHGGRKASCKYACSNRHYFKPYFEDRYRGKMVYSVRPDEKSIRSEIFKHGPVTAGMNTYDDLEQYTHGVYRSTMKREGGPGRHAVKIIGWGKENGLKYWLVANTWGTGFGLKGYIKFLRGENHCSIEGDVVAGRLQYYGASSRESKGNVAFSGAHKRSLSFMQKLLFYAYWIWICK